MAMRFHEDRFKESRGAAISVFHVNLIDAASSKRASLAMHAARASELLSSLRLFTMKPSQLVSNMQVRLIENGGVLFRKRKYGHLDSRFRA